MVPEIRVRFEGLDADQVYVVSMTFEQLDDKVYSNMEKDWYQTKFNSGKPLCNSRNVLYG